MVDVTQMEVQVRQMEEKLRNAASQRVREAETLRRRAAEAALQWVAAQRPRLAAFRKHVKGTPIEGLVDQVLERIPSPGPLKPAGGKTRRPSSRGKPSSKASPSASAGAKPRQRKTQKKASPRAP